MAKLRKVFAGGGLLTVLGLLVASALPAFAGYLKIANTYDDFQGVVFSSAWTYAFLIALVVITWVLTGVLGLLAGPKRWGLFAIVVGAVVGVLVCSPVDIVAMRGADAPGNPQRHRVVNLSGPLEELLTDRLDDRVRDKQAGETAVFVEEYVGRGKRGKADLTRRLDRSLRASDDDLSPGERRRVQDDVAAILETRRIDFETRLRRIARELYEAGLRDTVQALAR